MPDLLKSLTALTIATLLAAAPLGAQDAGTPPDEATGTPDEPTPAPDAAAEDAGAGELAMGEEVTPEDQIGRAYITDTHGDWQIRCIRTAGDKDPCQLYQLLKDEEGNSVAEISMFALPAGQQAVAGATIAAPLETLLTQQLTIAVDNGQARRYPFTWCAATGCFARVGFTAADVAAYKRGVKATMTIVPVASPETKVKLAISLTGFTAGFDAVSALNNQ